MCQQFFVPTGFIGNRNTFWWEKLVFLLNNTNRPKLEFKLKEKWYSFRLGTNTDKLKAFKIISRILKYYNKKEEEGCFLDSLSESLGVSKDRLSSQILTREQMTEMQGHRISFGAHSHTHPCSFNAGRNFGRIVFVQENIRRLFRRGSN